jgi:uncharacterized membrane protein YkvA (DUF1232 family)
MAGSAEMDKRKGARMGLRWRIDTLRADTHALYLAYRDPRLPWQARVLAILVLAYALSPIDLIPDFIPVLGYLDDLVLVPLGIWAVLRLIPPDVMAEARARAAQALDERAPTWRAGAFIVGALWLALLSIAALVAWRALR